jgi:hypothetical protein
VKKNGTNLITELHTKDMGGISAILTIKANTTVGPPIHQDEASPSVNIHHTNENRIPRVKIVSQVLPVSEKSDGSSDIDSFLIWFIIESLALFAAKMAIALDKPYILNSILSKMNNYAINTW